MPFWPLCCESKAILPKTFRSGIRDGVFIWKNFKPGCKDLGWKNRDLAGNRASPPGPFIWTRRNFCKGFSGVPRSETGPARSTGIIWRGPDSVQDLHEFLSSDYMRNFRPVDRDEIRKPKWRDLSCIAGDYCSFVYPETLIIKLIRLLLKWK